MNLATSVPTVPGVKVVESEGDESEEEESEILEESPCGRWLKRREEVGIKMFSLCVWDVSVGGKGILN